MSQEEEEEEGHFNVRNVNIASIVSAVRDKYMVTKEH